MIRVLNGWAAPIFLGLCIILGGASGVGAGIFVNGLLQILSIILILMALWSRSAAPVPFDAKLLALILILFATFVVASLIPLSPEVWRQLPGREQVLRGLEMVNLTPALPLSLAPHSTLSSMLWLLPPVAIFLVVLRSSHERRKRLPWVVLVLASFSVALGIAQLVTGPNSALRFYEITNPDLPVGFFANGNHYGTLILCALPFSSYLAARAVRKSSGSQRRSSLMLAAVTATFFVIGIISIGSLAGYGLLILSGIGSLLIYRRAAYGPLSRNWLLGVSAVLVALVALSLSSPVQDQALSGKLTDQPTSRKTIALTSLEAVRDFFPFGSGLGTFADVYRTYDDANRVNTEYVNHAHNDYIEFAFELGAVGILILLLFLGWWVFVSLKVWRSEDEGANLGRAASIVVGIVLLHSVVDYPIRTSAIAALFAAACAMLIKPMQTNRKPARKTAEESSQLRHVEAD